MKIGLLASTGKHLDSFFVEIRRALESQGVIVHAAAGTPASGMQAEVLNGLTQSPKWTNIHAVKSIGKWVKEQGLDVVLTNTATASALVRVSDVGVPVVYFCHGLHWNTGRKLTELVWHVVERTLLRSTAGAISINSDDTSWFEAHGPNLKRLRLVHGVGVPDSFLAEPAEWPDARPIKLLWAGDFTPRKRPHLALEVARRLSDRGIDFTLTMVGDGAELGTIRELVVRQGLGRHVNVLGRVDSIHQHIDASHYMLHTATWEGLPRVLLEGLARRRKAIAFDVKGVRDIPEVMLVEDASVNALATRIEELTQDPSMQVGDPSTTRLATTADTAKILAKFLGTCVGRPS